MPTIIDFIEKFQEDLLKRERRSASEMVRVYAEGWRKISRQIKRLNAELAELIKMGEQPGPGWIAQNERARALQAQIQRELAKFTKYAEESIVKQQSEAIRLALEQSQDLAELSIGHGLEGFWNRINRPAVEIMVGMNQPGSPLHKLLNDILAEGAEAARQALEQSILLGYGPERVAREIRNALGISLDRALKISRTEILRAYRIANLESYKQNPNIIKGWKWLTAGDGLVCISCRLMNGTVHKLSEEMHSHPNCRCAMSPITISWEDLGEMYGLDFSGIDNPPIDIDALAEKWGLSEKQVRQYKINQMSGKDWIESLSDNEQMRLMGKTKFYAWKDGAFDLDDLLRTTYSAEWGAGIRQARLDELLTPEQILKYKAMAKD